MNILFKGKVELFILILMTATQPISWASPYRLIENEYNIILI